jgi:hypothetical protein
MTDYVVEGGRLKFTVNLSDGTECYVEMDVTEDPEATVSDYIARREAEINDR